ncbi:hybrid sensor histidine kinase/response regulator [Pseudoduganella namucuonensis]|uniref:histidine kinase n=1 Tax=Pseudoduganella namucuonensis TaxID=1035707 RepID=A0A1I7LXP5_9BURK|nr:ATP-binding protein [Pseudoduganella namucuonensis]SFV14472.1 PAS domain S-box-containing protein [Pseudoduganella namucuonensis]
METDQDPWHRAPCGLLVAAADGAILRVNEAFCRWLGYSEHELVGAMRFPQLLPMGARVFHQTHLIPLLQIQGSVAEVQLDLLHKDGRRLPMMLNAQRREQDGVVRHEIAAFMATDRKKYERELLKARQTAEAAAADLRSAELRLRALNEALSQEHRRKDEFLATLAHELRNPLAPMASVIETLRLKNFADPHLDWARRMLDRQLQQMTHLVEDLLEVSRVSQGKLELRPQTVDLRAIVRGAADSARPAFDAARQTLSVDVGHEPVLLRIDPVRVTQIVSNLLNNACKYTPENGRISLVLRTADGAAVVDVKDNGIGIPPEQLDHIFEMFSQLTPALERAQGGLGIGLALARGLADLHGGALAVASEGHGLGSTFTLRLPLPAEALQAPEAAARVEAPAGSGLTTLIVDDNADAAESLGMALDFLGYDVRTAPTAQDALDAITASRPHLALLDIGLPDMTGYELARRIRQLPGGADMALIAITGWGQDDDKQAALDAGFDIHFTKPLDFQQLHRAISAMNLGH